MQFYNGPSPTDACFLIQIDFVCDAAIKNNMKRLVLLRVKEKLEMLYEPRSQHIWQQRNVAPQLINLWLTEIFIVFDRVIINIH